MIKGCWLLIRGCIARLFINSTFATTSKRYQTYCWSCKTLVTGHWMHFSVSGIGAKSFCPEKISNRTLIFTWCFLWHCCPIYYIYNWHHSDVIVMKLTDGIQNLIPYKEIRLGFFVFWMMPFCNLFIGWFLCTVIATCLRHDRIFNDHFIACFLLTGLVK